MLISLQRRMRFETHKPVMAYVHNYTAKTVAHSNHHADYADTRFFILPYSRPPPPPVLFFYPSLFSLPSFLLTERSACWLNLNYLLFFPSDFVPLFPPQRLTLSPPVLTLHPSIYFRRTVSECCHLTASIGPDGVETRIFQSKRRRWHLRQQRWRN